MPSILTAVPTGPRFGEKPSISGLCITVKVIGTIVAPRSFTSSLKVTGPSGASLGISKTSAPFSMPLIGILSSPRYSVWSEGLALKPDPNRRTSVPGSPNNGSIRVTASGAQTSNILSLVIVPMCGMITLNFPETAPCGTWTLISSSCTESTLHSRPVSSTWVS